MFHMQIAQCESEQELRRLLDDPEYDFRFSCGVGDPASSVSFTEKTKIVKGLILQYTIFSTIVELEQMKQGLTAQKFDELMKRHPGILMPVFESPEVKLTSALITVKKPECISYQNCMHCILSCYTRRYETDLHALHTKNVSISH